MLIRNVQEALSGTSVMAAKAASPQPAGKFTDAQDGVEDMMSLPLVDSGASLNLCSPEFLANAETARLVKRALFTVHTASAEVNITQNAGGTAKCWKYLTFHLLEGSAEIVSLGMLVHGYDYHFAWTKALGATLVGDKMIPLTVVDYLRGWGA